MIPTFCLLPAERLRMSFFCPSISPPINWLNSSRRLSVSSLLIPLTLPIKWKYSSGVRKSIRKPSSMYAPVNFFHSSDCAGFIAGSLPSCSFSVWGHMAISPLSHLIRSSKERNNVVFPAPLLPTSPTISPLPILKLCISSTVLSPKTFVRLLISRSMSFELRVLSYELRIVLAMLRLRIMN